MSIRPPFVDGILTGRKLVEFRRRPLACDVGTVVIYATAPVAAVVGEFHIGGQVRGTPHALWRRYSKVAGIDRRAFFEYFSGTDTAVAILISAVTEYDQPLPLAHVDPTGRPPQSFKYLAPELV